MYKLITVVAFACLADIYTSSLFCAGNISDILFKYPWSEHQGPDIDKLGTRGIPSQAVIHLIHVKRKIIIPLFLFDQMLRGARFHTTHFLAWEPSSYDAYNN